MNHTLEDTSLTAALNVCPYQGEDDTLCQTEKKKSHQVSMKNFSLENSPSIRSDFSNPAFQNNTK